MRQLGKDLMIYSLLVFLLGYGIFTQYEERRTRRYVAIPKAGMFSTMDSKFNPKKLRYQDAYIVEVSKATAESELTAFDVEEDIVLNHFAGCSKPDPIPTDPNQPAETWDWGAIKVKAPDATKITDAKDIIVGIVDTGIDINHPDTKDNLKACINFTSEGSSTDCGGNPHGQHVSGTIAAVHNNGIGYQGVSNAKIVMCKGLTEQGGYATVIADCISWTVRQGSQVINLSLGSTQPSTVIYNAIKAATDQGIIVVAAAGNNSQWTNWPANYDNVIAVSALDNNNQIAYFSSRGKIEYAAPGVDICSTIPGGKYSCEFSGTSMAAPHVAAVFALALSQGKRTIKADPLGPADLYGAGIVNAYKTVQ